LGTPVARS
jgi:hypothetical protein